MNVIAMVLLVLMGTSRAWLPTLNRVTAMVRRSWFGPLLVLVFVCGMVHYAATKGTNGMDRAGHQAESKIVGTDELRDGGVGFGEEESVRACEITNLCFTGILATTNGVLVDAAWPTNMFEGGTLLDLFVKVGAWTNRWRWIDFGQTLPGDTNASFFVEMERNRSDGLFELLL